MTIDMTKGTIKGNVVTYKEGTLAVTLTVDDTVDIKAGVWGEKLLRIYKVGRVTSCVINFSEPVQTFAMTALLPGRYFVTYFDKNDNATTPIDDVDTPLGGYVRLARSAETDGIGRIEIQNGLADGAIMFFKELQVTF